MSSSCCAIAAFGEYYAKEVQKIGEKLVDIPLAFEDIWSELADLSGDELEDDIATGLLQAAGDLGLDDVILDQAKVAMAEIVDPAIFPVVESALAEVRSVQAAIKVTASIVFIAYSDSVFHLARLLAAKIVLEAGNKLQILARLRTLSTGIASMLEVLEAGGVDTEELMEQISEAAGHVLLARTEATKMSYVADAGTEVRRTSANIAIGHIDSAIALLAPPTPPAPSAEGFAATMAMSAISASHAYLKEFKSTITQYQDSSKRLNTYIASFKSAVSDDKQMNLVAFQQQMLNKVTSTLASTYNSMMSASGGGKDMLDVSAGAFIWVRDLYTARTMISKLPPSVREVEGLNVEMLAYYDEAVSMLSSISGTHLTAGVEVVSQMSATMNRIHSVAGKMIQQTRTSDLQKLVKYASVESGTPEQVAAGDSLGTVAYVQFSDGTDLQLYSSKGVQATAAATGAFDSPISTTITGTLPSLIDQSEIHADLVIKAMNHYLLAPQPASSYVMTLLMGLLELLSMDRAGDMLEELNIDGFMSSSPMDWTYLGTAIDCLEGALEEALDQGLGDIADAIDNLLAPMWAKFNAVEARLKKSAAFSVKNILKNLEDSIKALDDAKATVEDLVDRLEMDC